MRCQIFAFVIPRQITRIVVAAAIALEGYKKTGSDTADLLIRSAFSAGTLAKEGIGRPARQQCEAQKSVGTRSAKAGIKQQ